MQALFVFGRANSGLTPAPKLARVRGPVDCAHGRNYRIDAACRARRYGIIRSRGRHEPPDVDIHARRRRLLSLLQQSSRYRSIVEGFAAVVAHLARHTTEHHGHAVTFERYRRQALLGFDVFADRAFHDGFLVA